MFKSLQVWTFVSRIEYLVQALQSECASWYHDCCWLVNRVEYWFSCMCNCLLRQKILQGSEALAEMKIYIWQQSCKDAELSKGKCLLV